MVQVVELIEVVRVLLQVEQEQQTKVMQVVMHKVETQVEAVELELLVQQYLLQHPLLILVVRVVQVKHLLFQGQVLQEQVVAEVDLLQELQDHHG